MGYSRSSKDQLQNNGIVPKSRYKRGEDIKYLMQNIYPKKEEFHIPIEEHIPTKLFEKKSNRPNSLVRKRANLALRYRGD